MYEKHFELDSDPFRLGPSSRPCFAHATHRRARAYLSYALGRREGVLLLTGTPGTGKTSVVREFADSIADPDLAIERIVCSTLDGEDLLRAVALRFGVHADGAKKAELYERLAARLAGLWEHGRRPLLIVDEAQGLTRDALEEVRALTNLQRGDDALLQVFLVGQPALAETIRSPGLEHLHQRLIVACRLEPLAEDEIGPYVRHCLAASGWRGEPPFDDDIYPLVHGESFGIARRVNLIMSRLMLHAMVQERPRLTADDARKVLGGPARGGGLLASQSWKSAEAANAPGHHEEHVNAEARA